MRRTGRVSSQPAKLVLKNVLKKLILRTVVLLSDLATGSRVFPESSMTRHGARHSVSVAALSDIGSSCNKDRAAGEEVPWSI